MRQLDILRTKTIMYSLLVAFYLRKCKGRMKRCYDLDVDAWEPLELVTYCPPVPQVRTWPGKNSTFPKTLGPWVGGRLGGVSPTGALGIL